jgi:hypothetical protein
VATGDQQHRRVNVALAAVTCGRLTQAAVVKATRAGRTARADQYGVNVTESWRRSPSGARRVAGPPEVVLEHWGGDAEMLKFESTLKSPGQRTDPVERVRVAARTLRDYDLDSLVIEYEDGSELSADREMVVLRAPRRSRLRPRDVLIRAPVGDVL